MVNIYTWISILNTINSDAKKKRTKINWFWNNQQHVSIHTFISIQRTKIFIALIIITYINIIISFVVLFFYGGSSDNGGSKCSGVGIFSGRIGNIKRSVILYV